MNMKRSLVLLLTLVMLLSAFAPTLGVFATEISGHEHSEGKETLNYVSLGDSMTNGIGMDGYDITDNPDTSNDGRNGYLEVAPDSYPAQFAAWLAGYQGTIANGQTEYVGSNGKVNLTQLATSGARVEDVYYILNYGTENEFAPDYWTLEEMLKNSDRWGDPKNKDDDTYNIEVAEKYREAIENADIISLATGNGNFGVFLMGRIMNLVGFGDPADLEDDNVNYDYYTVENAVALCGANEELIKIVMDTYNDALEYLADMNFPMELITRFADLAAYTTASYVVHTMKLVDLIVEMNPDVTIMFLPLINNANGFVIDFTMNGKTNTIDMGTILGGLYNTLNAFLAAYPTVKQAHGLFSEATFLYAELPVDENGETINVHTYAQAFSETLYVDIDVEKLNGGLTWTKNENGEDVIVGYPESRRFCHGRFVSDVLGFALPILKPDVAPAYDSDNDAYYVKEIMEYEVYKALGPVAFAQYAQTKDPAVITWVCAYLGVVEATLNSLTTIPLVDMNEMDIPADGNVNVFTLLGPAVEKVVVKLNADTDAAINPVFDENGALVYNAYAYIVENLFLPSMAGLGVADLETAVALLDNPSLAGAYASEVEGKKELAILLAQAWASPDVLAGALESEGLVEALLGLFGRLKLAWGLSAHPSAIGHDTLTESLEIAYETNWTVQKQTIKNAMEYYMGAYELVDTMGYIDLSVAAIDEAIVALNVAINEVEAGVLGVTEELKAEIVKELYAIIATLEEVREVLATDAASDVEGLVAAVLALEDDLYTHLANLSALFGQAGLDIYELVLVPGFNEAIRVLNEVVIPAALELAEYAANKLVEHVQAQLDVLYSELLGFSREVYNQIIDALVRIQLHVQEKLGNAVAPIINTYFAVLETLTEICGTIEEAVKVAGQIVTGIINAYNNANDKLNGTLDAILNKITAEYTQLLNTLYNAMGNIEEAIKAANTILGNILNTVDGAIDGAINAYNVLVTKLVAIYGTVEEALVKAAEIYNNIVTTVNGAVTEALALYNAILDVLVETYGTIENVVIVAGQIFSYAYGFIAENLTPEKIATIVNDIVDIVVETYGATQDAYYVAAQVYVYLVNMVNGTFEGNYVVDADSMYVALGSSFYGEELAAMLGLEDKFINFYLEEEYLEAVAGADLVTVKFDNGEALTFLMMNLPTLEELDWDKYLDAEGQAALDELLAGIKAEVAGNDQLVELATSALEYMGFTGMTVTNEIVAEYLAYTVECLVYCYAEFIDRVIVTLDNIYTVAPEATVVITGIQNPLADLGLELGEYGQIVDLFVDGLNAHLITAAFVNENTIFVESENAQDIFNALNVTFAPAVECNHVYDDCLDTTCNLCGEVRVAGHSFTNYVSNNDASCGKNATETATCDNCDATSTREIPNTALEHQYGEWEVVTEATTEQPGLRKRTCSICGNVETEEIPLITKDSNKVSPWMIAAIVGLLVICVLIKKKPAEKKASDKKDADKKTTDKKEAPAKSKKK